MIELKKKKIILTGGAGFLGRFVEKNLNERGCGSVFIPHIEDYDLRYPENIRGMYKDASADIVIHLAAVVGGIGANRENPGSCYSW